jgi:hypothetical protein
MGIKTPRFLTAEISELSLYSYAFYSSMYSNKSLFLYTSFLTTYYG